MYKILVADDELNIRELIKKYAKYEGYDVDDACNGIDAIEKTREYNGLYHVLHGALSPMDGVSPEDLKINELLLRLNSDVKEIIMATNPTVSGTATAVSYSNWTEGATITRGLDTGKAGYEVSPKNLRSNIFDGSTTQQFMLLWPVESQHLHSSSKMETSEEGVVTYPQDWKMYIKYTADEKTYEKKNQLP